MSCTSLSSLGAVVLVHRDESIDTLNVRASSEVYIVEAAICWPQARATVDRRAGYIGRVFVAPNRRGKGYGQLFLSLASQYLTKAIRDPDSPFHEIAFVFGFAMISRTVCQSCSVCHCSVHNIH